MRFLVADLDRFGLTPETAVKPVPGKAAALKELVNSLTTLKSTVLRYRWLGRLRGDKWRELRWAEINSRIGFGAPRQIRERSPGWAGLLTRCILHDLALLSGKRPPAVQGLHTGHQSAQPRNWTVPPANRQKHPHLAHLQVVPWERLNLPGGTRIENLSQSQWQTLDNCLGLIESLSKTHAPELISSLSISSPRPVLCGEGRWQTLLEQCVRHDREMLNVGAASHSNTALEELDSHRKPDFRLSLTPAHVEQRLCWAAHRCSGIRVLDGPPCHPELCACLESLLTAHLPGSCRVPCIKVTFGQAHGARTGSACKGFIGRDKRRLGVTIDVRTDDKRELTMTLIVVFDAEVMRPRDLWRILSEHKDRRGAPPPLVSLSALAEEYIRRFPVRPWDDVYHTATCNPAPYTLTELAQYGELIRTLPDTERTTVAACCPNCIKASDPKSFCTSSLTVIAALGHLSAQAAQAIYDSIHAIRVTHLPAGHPSGSDITFLLEVAWRLNIDLAERGLLVKVVLAFLPSGLWEDAAASQLWAICSRTVSPDNVTDVQPMLCDALEEKASGTALDQVLQEAIPLAVALNTFNQSCCTNFARTAAALLMNLLPESLPGVWQTRTQQEPTLMALGAFRDLVRLCNSLSDTWDSTKIDAIEKPLPKDCNGYPLRVPGPYWAMIRAWLGNGPMTVSTEYQREVTLVFVDGFCGGFTAWPKAWIPSVTDCNDLGPWLIEHGAHWSVYHSAEARFIDLFHLSDYHNNVWTNGLIALKHILVPNEVPLAFDEARYLRQVTVGLIDAFFTPASPACPTRNQAVALGKWLEARPSSESSAIRAARQAAVSRCLDHMRRCRYDASQWVKGLEVLQCLIAPHSVTSPDDFKAVADSYALEMWKLTMLAEWERWIEETLMGNVAWKEDYAGLLLRGFLLTDQQGWGDRIRRLALSDESWDRLSDDPDKSLSALEFEVRHGAVPADNARSRLVGLVSVLRNCRKEACERYDLWNRCLPSPTAVDCGVSDEDVFLLLSATLMSKPNTTVLQDRIRSLWPCVPIGYIRNGDRDLFKIFLSACRLDCPGVDIQMRTAVATELFVILRNDLAKSDEEPPYLDLLLFLFEETRFKDFYNSLKVLPWGAQDYLRAERHALMEILFYTAPMHGGSEKTLASAAWQLGLRERPTTPDLALALIDFAAKVAKTPA
jgi:hypothetical protein